MDQTSALLRRAMPFQTVSDEMLQDIAKLATSRSYAPGDVIYNVGDEAEDICIVASGSVQHVLAAGADGSEVEQVMRSGDVFSNNTPSVWPSTWHASQLIAVRPMSAKKRI